MINKFHKTAYPRGHNFNVVSSSQGKRTPLNQQTPSDSNHPQKLQLPIQRKIDIEPSLLFTHKNYPKPANKINQPQPRKTTNRSQAKFYETSTGFTQSKHRPESKQQPRIKMLNEGKLKTEVFQHQRPQTSKGERQMKGNISTEIRQRQISEQDDQIPFQIKVTSKKTRNVQSSYSKRFNNQDPQLPFNTSIDPEFLSLFAN